VIEEVARTLNADLVVLGRGRNRWWSHAQATLDPTSTPAHSPATRWVVASQPS